MIKTWLNMIKHDSCSKILGFTVLRPYSIIMEDQAEMDNDEESWATSTATLIATGNEEKRRLGCLFVVFRLQSDQIVSFRPNVQGLGVGVARWCRFVRVGPNFFHRWGGVPWLVSQWRSVAFTTSSTRLGHLHWIICWWFPMDSLYGRTWSPVLSYIRFYRHVHVFSLFIQSSATLLQNVAK